jgi:Spy/CpxP family protein refolding chaperone
MRSTLLAVIAVAVAAVSLAPTMANARPWHHHHHHHRHHHM